MCPARRKCGTANSNCKLHILSVVFIDFASSMLSLTFLTARISPWCQNDCQVACRALYYFTMGPRIPHTSKNSVWHPDKMWTKQVVVNQNLPARLMHVIRQSTTGSTITKTAEQLELLEQAIRCAGTYSQRNPCVLLDTASWSILDIPLEYLFSQVPSPRVIAKRWIWFCRWAYVQRCCKC